MHLVANQERWEELGKLNPFWAILTGNQKWELDQFFLSGDLEISKVMRYLERLGLRVGRRRALDFGCGVGRLTQALCSHFFQCDGVDIAPSMIEHARRHNRFARRCEYHVNASDDLSGFGPDSFDFIYSNIALQHIEPEFVRNYVREFVRVLCPGGVAVFQMPSDKTSPGHGALPDEAYQAKITVRRWGMVMRSGSSASLNVTVRNLSNVTWPSQMDNPDHPPVMLGNHWLDRRGKVTLNDDGRAVLPHDVRPTEQVNVRLQITAPAEPGIYRVELDLVQEMITWFAPKGSRTTSFLAWVTGKPQMYGTARENAAPADDDHDALAMHAIPKTEMVALIESAGARIVDISRDGCAGPEWQSFRYCVVK
jgi:SAM-dependent methyltransferase